MKVVMLSGSPGAASRSTTMLDHIQGVLISNDIDIAAFGLDDFNATSLVKGRWNDPGIEALRHAVETADALVIGTPVYQASFSGGLKLMLDVLPQGALKHKTVLCVASGGSDQHLLVLDYALKPVLSSLGAYHQLAGVYASPAHIHKESDGRYRLGDDIRKRLDLVTDELVNTLFTMTKHAIGSQKPNRHLHDKSLAMA